LSILEDFYECDVVYNGRQALERLTKQNYDLINSDVMMPEMDGFELREQLNNHVEWRHIPFILLTARSMDEDILRGFRLGIDDYIIKPFNTSEYKARIDNLLRTKIERNVFIVESTEIESSNNEFVKTAENVVIDNIDDSTFTVGALAKEMNYSAKQLGRKLRQMTGYSTVEFILEIRLQRAYQLLKTQRYRTVNEVRLAVGIESAAYFTTKFTERFGIRPKEVM
ncbi:MAG: response regulator, partial [Desulfobulbia bacterium]